jgi:hypothetical protein
MSYVTLVHPHESRQVSGVQLILKCTTFKQNLTLVAAPYVLQSSVSLNIFHDFISALEDRAIQITSNNYAGLILLANEFGCENLVDQLEIFRQTAEFKISNSTQDVDLREKILSLEELIDAQDRRIAALQNDLFTQFQQIKLMIIEWFPRLHQIEIKVNEVSAELKTLCLSSQAEERLVAEIEQLREEIRAIQAMQHPIAQSVITQNLDSQIISDFPAIFMEFKSMQFRLLWRGSRDGFGGKDFHNRCDGHGNTLTVIADTKGNIFGGYTPLTWESRERIGNGSNRYKTDDTLGSWLFTLKNPHNIGPKKFALKSNGNRQAIFCGCSGGPEFGIGLDGFGDIAIRNQSNTSNTNSTSFGGSYINDTNVEDEKLLTGSSYFIVKEIEIFEIIP